jgi:hypothetical protein
MGDSATLAVVAGLIIGIAFIVLFSMSIKPTLSPSDNQIIAAANKFPEANAFFSNYPDAKVEIDRSGGYGSLPIIVYHYEKIYDDSRINEARMFVHINTLTGMPSHISIDTDCAVSSVNGFGVTFSEYGHSIIETLQTTECAK